MEKTIHEMYQEIKQIEVQKLKDAVKAKGGKYVFEVDNTPIVAISKFDTPCDAIIESVIVDDRDFLVMSARDEECYFDTFTLFADEIMYGHIDYIIDCIQ